MQVGIQRVVVVLPIEEQNDRQPVTQTLQSKLNPEAATFRPPNNAFQGFDDDEALKAEARKHQLKLLEEEITNEESHNSLEEDQ